MPVPAQWMVGTHAASASGVAPAPDESIFTTQTPATPDGNDTVGYELGVKFQAAVAGNIRGVRFWRSSNDLTTTQTVRLWTSGGTLLASKAVTGLSGSGWTTVLFDAPINISANTTYVASRNVTAAAGSVEELAASIGEIASQAAKSTGVAERAVSEAQRTAQTMTGGAAPAMRES